LTFRRFDLSLFKRGTIMSKRVSKSSLKTVSKNSVKKPSQAKPSVKGSSAHLSSPKKVSNKPKGEVKKTSKVVSPVTDKQGYVPKVKELKSELKQHLLNEKADIEKRISAIQFRPSESTGDFGDISSALSDEGLLLIERDRLIDQLEKVKQVLNRLTTNKYFANCDDCGEEIEYKRLIFIPTARRCVHCQQNAERK